MKNIILFIIILFFLGCVAQSKRLCSEYGFTKGTRDFSNCVMNETHRAQDSINRSGERMAVSNRRYQDSIERRAEKTYNLFKPSITCETNKGIRGNSTTVCQ